MIFIWRFYLPRYIHHIVINSDIPQFDVENLSKQKLIMSQSNEFISAQCLEIHAGGFTRIEQHLFQNTANYLRRTKSFGLNKEPIELHPAESNGAHMFSSQSMMNLAAIDSSPASNDASNNGINANKQKISLLDYKKSQQQHVVVQNKNIVNVDAGKQQTQQAPRKQEETLTEPAKSANIDAKANLSASQSNLPSMSLIDEVKKRIQQKQNEASPEVKWKDLKSPEISSNSEDEQSKRESKRKHKKHKKSPKRSKSKKTMKRPKSGLSPSLSSSVSLSSDYDDLSSLGIDSSLSSSLSDDEIEIDEDLLTSSSTIDAHEADEPKRKKSQRSKSTKKKKKKRPKEEEDGEIESDEEKIRNRHQKHRRHHHHHRDHHRDHHHHSHDKKKRSRHVDPDDDDVKYDVTLDNELDEAKNDAYDLDYDGDVGGMLELHSVARRSNNPPATQSPANNAEKPVEVNFQTYKETREAASKIVFKYILRI